MNRNKTKFSILTALLFALMIMVAAPATSWAQGNGRGRGNARHRNYGLGLDKKCGKFVNCHDARDGRVDGRGRRRGLTWRNGGFVPRGYRVRNRLNNNELRNRRATWTLAQRRAYNRRNR